MLFRNKLGGGCGRPYRKRRAIPQGDPWSNAMLALILTPWVRMVQVQSTVPRVLADDLSLLAFEEHVDRFVQAVEEAC
eukprot:1321527-Alexandrium_andersonii.AAC.1